MIRLFRGGGSAADHFHAGTAAAQRGELDAAIASLRRAVELDPNLAAAHCNLGGAYRDKGTLDASRASYARAAALDPRLMEAHHGLGQVLSDQQFWEQAAECYAKALALAPDSADTHYGAGNAYVAIGDWRQALKHFRRAIALRPAHEKARWALVMAQLPAVPDAETDPAERRRAFGRELDAFEHWIARGEHPEAWRVVGAQMPFYLAYQETPNRDLLARYGALCARLMAPWQRAQAPASRGRPDRGTVRVGIVSAHFFNHAVWTGVVRSWLEGLDRGLIELELFHLGQKEDEETRRARTLAARFHAGAGDFAQWARTIAGREPDILIYPEVGMDSITTKLASLRLAPVQAASWGHPETTGLPTLDYYISAQDLEPPGAEENYSETLVKLPGLGARYAAAPVRADLAAARVLTEGAKAPLFVCPGTPFKYAPAHDRLLAEIARRSGGTLFFFIGRPEPLSALLRERLRRAFAKAGVDFDAHVRFVPWQSPAVFHGLLEHAQVCLDTLGFSGFNTAMQAALAGIPMVTRDGRFLRGRLASGVLRRLGAPELIAASDAEYVELALALAQDEARRIELGLRLRQGCASLAADPAPARGLQEFILSAAREPARRGA
ncbi:MAG: tetratricopeptide repeat protein [Burkholderiales bacterium]